MTLPLPAYVSAARIQDPSLRYKWDDWNVEQAEDPMDEAVLNVLSSLSQRAILAFMTASGEWIAYRFDKLTNNPGPWRLLESAWARTIDLRYGDGRWQEYAEDWGGPVKGPVKRGLDRVEVAMEQLAYEGVDPARDGALLANLTAYVMPDPGPYLTWRERVLERFSHIYPRNPADQLGDVVPRKAANSEQPFSPDQTEVLINQYLAGLDHRANPFLNSPEEMLAQEFDGKPYTFDVNADRAARRRYGTLPHYHVE